MTSAPFPEMASIAVSWSCWGSSAGPMLCSRARRLHPDFFFQAEDGIRDRTVTGVQTCALPIYYVSKFRENIPRYMERHREKSGMTGWAQVNGLRGDTSIEERTKYDLWYVENWSIWRSEERRVGKEGRKQGALEDERGKSSTARR